MGKVKWLIISLLFICLLISGCFSNQSSYSPGPGTTGPVVTDGDTEYLSNQVLVRFKPGANTDQVLKLINGRVIKYYQKLNCYQIGFSSTDRFNVWAAARILKDSNQVFFAEPNYIYKTCGIPNDPDYSKQWGLADINAPAGWDSSSGASGIKIAIVDTGIDNNHPDLSGKVTLGYNAIDESVGLPGDDNGHGTHCAGIAAAYGNNNIGGAGVAWQCNLMAVKVLDENGSGQIDNIAVGIVWAVDNGADVISMSLGGRGYSRLLQNAIDYALNANVAVVAAAGNGSKLNDNNFPSGYPGVISVGATNPNKMKATFSTESNLLFISAPGEMIYSTLPGNKYGYMSGTSMATPYVSGAVALIKARFGNIPVTQVYSQLKKTATDIGAGGWDQQTGWGRLNLGGALSYLQSDEFGKLIVTVKYGDQLVPDAQVLLTNNSTGKVIYNIQTGDDQLPVGGVSTGQACFWALPAGNYTVTADIRGYRTTATCTVQGGETTNEILSKPVPAAINYATLNETAENFPSQVMVDGAWSQSTTNPHSASYCWKGSFSGSNNNNKMSLITVPVDMTGSVAPQLHFWQRFVSSGFEDLRVEASTDYGMTWSQVDLSWSGIQTSWDEKIISLDGYKTQTHLMLQFCYEDNGSITDEWCIDDISIDEAPPPIFSETAENFPSQVMAGGTWAKTSNDANSAPYSWTDSPGGSYTDYTDMSLTTVSINLTGSTAPKLYFWHRYQVESGYDYCGVEVSTNNGVTWSSLATRWTGNQATWKKESIDLTAYKNQANLLLRFRLTSDSSITGDGWYIDDISITVN